MTHNAENGRVNGHAGVVIAGSLLVAEGAAFAAFGPRYLEFMERNGLMDFSKRLLRKLNIRSQGVFVGIGLAEAVWGLVLLRRATA